MRFEVCGFKALIFTPDSKKSAEWRGVWLCSEKPLWEGGTAGRKRSGAFVLYKNMWQIFL